MSKIDSVCPSVLCPDVCLSVTKTSNCFSFLFLNGIEPLFGRQFSMTPSTKRCSSTFDLGPLTPKIYSQNWHKIAYKSACMADRLEMFGPTRGFSGMAWKTFRKYVATVPPLFFLRRKFHPEILTGSPERGRQTTVARGVGKISYFIALCVSRKL